MDRDAKRRPLILAKILFERTDEEHYLTTAQLMDILEKEYGIKTHRQTIPSDIAILRERGMDIQEVMSAQKRYNLVSREFDLAELKMLIDAVESAKFISRKKSEQLVRKLSGLASQYQAKSLKRNISVEKRVKYENEMVVLIVDGINEAINRGKKISFQYFKYGANKKPQLRHDGKPFVFSPHKLVWNGDFYYMVGVFEKEDKIGVFRIDRILNRPKILDEDAVPFPKGFSFNRYLQSSFRMFGTEATAVELICSNDVMDAILDKFGKSVMTYNYDEDHFCATVDVAVSNVFYSWVFGFDGKVKINAPVEIQGQYMNMLRFSLDSIIGTNIEEH